MLEPTNSKLDEATRVLREIAVHQGLAYITYGEALQRFGARKIDWPEMFKASGDIYIEEAATTVWSLIRAEIDVYAWMLSMAGAKPLHPKAETEQEASPADKPAKRGRR